jgi:hypothetical protein
MLARLDRIYSFASHPSPVTDHIKDYRILGDCVLSDHAPISFELELTKVKPTGSRYMVNCAYLKDPLVITDLHKQWRSYSAQTSFFNKIRKITK